MQAAAAVANALAALAHEKDARNKRPSSTFTVLAALVEAKNTVDLYA